MIEQAMPLLQDHFELVSWGIIRISSYVFIFMFSILERGGGKGKGGQKKHRCERQTWIGCLRYKPQMGIGLATRVRAPTKNTIEPATFQFAVRCPTNWAMLAGAYFFFFFWETGKEGERRRGRETSIVKHLGHNTFCWFLCILNVNRGYFSKYIKPLLAWLPKENF